MSRKSKKDIREELKYISPHTKYLHESFISILKQREEDLLFNDNTEVDVSIESEIVLHTVHDLQQKYLVCLNDLPIEMATDKEFKEIFEVISKLTKLLKLTSQKLKNKFAEGLLLSIFYDAALYVINKYIPNSDFEFESSVTRPEALTINSLDVQLMDILKTVNKLLRSSLINSNGQNISPYIFESKTMQATSKEASLFQEQFSKCEFLSPEVKQSVVSLLSTVNNTQLDVVMGLVFTLNNQCINSIKHLKGLLGLDELPSRFVSHIESIGQISKACLESKTVSMHRYQDLILKIQSNAISYMLKEFFLPRIVEAFNKDVISQLSIKGQIDRASHLVETASVNDTRKAKYQIVLMPAIENIGQPKAVKSEFDEGQGIQILP